MRIILSFLIGFLLFFYIGELITIAGQKLSFIKKVLHLNHSLLGMAFFLVGLISSFLSTNPVSLLISFLSIGAGLGLMTHHFLRKHYLFFEKAEQDFATNHEKGIERFLEIVPGALTWIALTSPVWLSFTLPFAVAYLIVIADAYWLLNALKIAVLIYVGYKKMDYAKKQDWLENLKQDFPDTWDNYYHLLVLPTYNESLEVLAPAFDAAANSCYPKEKIFLAVGFEERAQQKDPAGMEKKIKHVAEISKQIGGAFSTIHPFGLPGEVPGPGTNRNWMINNAVKEFEKRGIKPEQILVTTLDADFVIHEQFLAGALHKYLSTPASERNKRSYTGAFLYYNNYWQAPSPTRLVAAGTAFWQLAEMVGSDKYMNFSSLSMNLKPLLEVGLWIPHKVNDDSGFYWKAYYHFKGDYKVIPHFLPISADTVLDVNLVKTLQNQYLQLKRWAYGVEHVPFIVTQYFKSDATDFWDKTDKLIFALWGYLKWGTLALFVTFAGMLIPLINPHYTESAVAYNLPVVSSWILTAAFIGMLSTIYVHEKTVPKRPKNWGLLTRLWSYIQWMLIPIVMVTISSLPAIDAQTSLMLGRYLEFRTTTKARLKPTDE